MILDRERVRTMPKDILAVVDVGDRDEQFLEDARAYAQFHDAHLSILILSAVPSSNYALAVGTPFVMLTKYLEASDTKKDRVSKFAEREGVEVRVLSSDPSLMLDRAPIEARYADLILFGPREAYENERLRRRFVENIAFSSGRPIMILPSHWKPRSIERLAIGWNATREATRALGDGLHLAAAGASVDVVIVGGKPSPDGHGSEPGADIARNISRQGFTVTVHPIEADMEETSTALLRFAQHHRADLLVVGAAAHSRLREMFLGGVTHDLIDGGPVPILLGH